MKERWNSNQEPKKRGSRREIESGAKFLWCYLWNDSCPDKDWIDLGSYICNTVSLAAVPRASVSTMKLREFWLATGSKSEDERGLDRRMQGNIGAGETGDEWMLRSWQYVLLQIGVTRRTCSRTLPILVSGGVWPSFTLEETTASGTPLMWGYARYQEVFMVHNMWSLSLWLWKRGII